jgi:uncharacterized damage-inducible protein DinB
MKIDDLKILYDFNYWARDKILLQVDKLDIVEFHLPVESSYGSLQATLVHALSAEWIWRIRCQEKQSPASLLPFEEFPTVASIQSFWIDEQRKMTDFLESLQDGDLKGSVTYQRTGGQQETNTLWHILWHVVNHGTEHRSEAASILTAFGHSPGDLDFIHYWRSVSDQKYSS